MPPFEQEIKKVLNILKDNSEVSMLGQFSGEDPFYVLISTILSARNRDEMTIIAARKLFSKYKTPKEIAAAPLSRLEPLIKQSGFYKIKAKRIKEVSRIIHEVYHDRVPDDLTKLVSLPGVGNKTANCVLVYAFDKPAIPVDTHVHRISNRLGWVKTNSPQKTEEALTRLIPKDYWLVVNESFVIHGQTICKPIIPECWRCPISKYCKYPDKKLG